MVESLNTSSLSGSRGLSTVRIREGSQAVESARGSVMTRDDVWIHSKARDPAPQQRADDPEKER